MQSSDLGSVLASCRRHWIDSASGDMGHLVTGFIGNPETLAAFAGRVALRPPVALPAGLALLPLRDSDLDSFLPLPLTGETEGFTYLSEQLLEVLSQLSVNEPVMYFETEYFGGAGMQGAVVMERCRAVYGPRSAESGPINEALALLGVRICPPARDQFETLGLGRHRSTADWLGEEDDDDA